MPKTPDDFFQQVQDLMHAAEKDVTKAAERLLHDGHRASVVGNALVDVGLRLLVAVEGGLKFDPSLLDEDLRGKLEQMVPELREKYRELDEAGALDPKSFGAMN